MEGCGTEFKEDLLALALLFHEAEKNYRNPGVSKSIILFGPQPPSYSRCKAWPTMQRSGWEAERFAALRSDWLPHSSSSLVGPSSSL